MTMNELITASADNYCGSAFLPPDKLRAQALERAENVRRPAFGRRFALLALAAVLALALTVTAVAAASGAIRLPALERLFGVAPAAGEVEDRAVFAPLLYDEVLRWNWLRAEAGLDTGDPAVIADAYRAGLLSIGDVYAMFGADAPTDGELSAALERFPELEGNERELSEGEARYSELSASSAEGRELSASDEAFVLGYSALKYETENMRAELSALLTRMGRGGDAEGLPEKLPADYRSSAPDLELMSDREKIAALLADSRAGEGWLCWVLRMDKAAGGWRVCAAFARLDESGEHARLLDEDGNEVYVFADGAGRALSDLEAEAFMPRLPKWSYTLKKTAAEVTTSTGAVKSYYGDNSFSITASRRFTLLDPDNEFIYKSAYEYVVPALERDEAGRAVQPFFPEALENGACCFDGRFLNTRELYAFVEEYRAGGSPVLTVCTTDGSMVLSAADPENLSVTYNVFDFDSGAVYASRRLPTDFTIEDDVLAIHYGSLTEEFPLERADWPEPYVPSR